MLKKAWDELVRFFGEDEDPDEPIYDPAHFGGMIVLVIFSSGALFWLLWTLLVFEGGIFEKVVPAVEVLLTGKTLADFGWVGYPFEMGVFQGFLANSLALLITIALIVGIWWLFKKTEPAGEEQKNGDGN